jgi:hypothetical protein
MEKKELKIISSTEAKELNPLGNIEPSLCEWLKFSRERHQRWHVLNNNLKTYTIQNLNKDAYTINTIHIFNCNEELLTCNIK